MSLTPNQIHEREVSARRLEDVAILRELDLATEEQIRALVWAEIPFMVGQCGYSPSVAYRMRRLQRERIWKRWKGQDEEDREKYG